MKIFDEMKKENYEQIVLMQDEETGLKGITVIHNTTLGPALGGTRYWTYDSEEEAIADAMCLAKGMTYKNAASGLSLGGGKTVIMKDPDNPVNEEALFRAYGRFIQGLNGRYITAADVGTHSEIMDYIYQETPYVVGTTMKPGTSGNPSPTTAHGVYVGMKAAAKRAFGDNSLNGKIVLLEGAGSVGLTLAEKLLSEGATVIATDIYDEPKQKAEELGCQVVESNELLNNNADIYSPCALGATINDENIEKLKTAGVKVVAGSANNQLAEDKHGDILEEEGIVYAPDYILNAGGVIQVADEFNGGFDKERATKQVENIYNQIEKVFEISDRDNISTHEAADRFSEERIQAIQKTKRFFNQSNKSVLG